MEIGGRRFSIALAVAVGAALLPTLARTAQSGDGVEFVRVALQGGVPHPTGFPLQAWLDRVVVRLPLGTPAYRISLLDLLAHAATVFLLAETLRRLDVSPTGRAASAAAFAFFPPVWALAVAPEVFSIANLIVASALLQLAVLAGREEGSIGLRDAVLLGALAGGAAAQHPITIEASPVFLSSALLLARARRGRAPRLALAAGAFAAIAAGSFASLPLLRGQAAWPDWGHLASVSGILRHALRTEYGAAAFTGAETGPTLRGLPVFGRDLALYGAATAVAAALGGFSWIRRSDRRPYALAVAGTIAAGLLVLDRARMADDLLAIGYLSKLDGPIVLALALFAGAGVDSLTRGIRGAAGRRAAAAGVAAFAVVLFVVGRPYADASRDDTLERLASALGVGLPAEAVYLAENDVETFLGASTPTGIRYPIAAGLLPRAWYRDSIIPRIEPRLRLTGVEPPTPDDVAAEALSQGWPVAGSSRELAEIPGTSATLSGLFYVARPVSGPEFTEETVRGALALCPIARGLPALPRRGHVFSRHFFNRFARAYAGAAVFLDSRGEIAAAAAARAVERALLDGGDPAAWAAACDELAEATVSSAPGRAGP